jgi:DNA-binding transcriptional LysR family regulator
LTQHDCVVRSSLPEASLWRYRSKRGVEESVQVRGRFESNSTAAINDAVASGLGIGRAAYWQIGELVQQRRVELILTDYELSPLPLQALWLPTRRLPARTRLFVEFLASRLESVAL